MRQLLTVDFMDNITGTIEKNTAHQGNGVLHRAFSVFIVHDGKMLIQRRAAHKYHTPGLWTNACCSHPWCDDLQSCVLIRLGEELNIYNTNVTEEFSFVYRAPVGNGLVEYEYDHVFLCDYDGEIELNLDECDAIRWVDLDELSDEVIQHPEMFTPWFIIAYPQLLKRIHAKTE